MPNDEGPDGKGPYCFLWVSGLNWGLTKYPGCDSISKKAVLPFQRYAKCKEQNFDCEREGFYSLHCVTPPFSFA